MAKIDKILAMDWQFILQKTPYNMQKKIALQARQCRKRQKLTQEELSKKAGVSLGSLKRFEQTGEIALASLLKLAYVLDCLDDFTELFNHREYQSIEEVINEQD